MKEFFADRLVRAIFTVTGLVAVVGGPVPKTAPKLQSFSSNGCSVFPDGDTFACCYVHDMAYWAGGTAAERRRADRALELCVADVTGTHVIGGIMYAAVTIFGLPGIPTRVQWGYGWEDTRQVSYDGLTRGEQDQVNARKLEACRALARDSDTGRYMVDGTHWVREVDFNQLCAAPQASPARR